MTRLLATLLLLLAAATPAGAAEPGAGDSSATGAVKGRVVDAELRSPLEGVEVTLAGTVPPGVTAGAAVTDTDGAFAFASVPVGDLTVRCRYPGMAPQVVSDLVVRSGRTTFVLVEYTLRVEVAGEVTVTGGYFPQAAAAEQPVSSVVLSGEEIRRAPGTAGDVTRTVYGLPSVAKISDTINALVVRGGSPGENAFYIDNIEVPNINHFPLQGSSAGPIGLLNVDFVRDLEFIAGGFNSSYGAKMSSVMDIDYREGNREAFDAQLDVNLAGAGLSAEGPAGSNGSWLLSARRSYLDLVLGAAGEDDEVNPPTYADVQGKLAFSLGERDTLTALLVTGDDAFEEEREDAVEEGDEYYGRMESKEAVTGVNWTHLWGERGWSDTSLAYTVNRFDDLWSKTATSRTAYTNLSTEQALSVRNVNRLVLSPRHQLRFGVEARQRRYDYAYFIDAWTDDFGVERPSVSDDYRKEVGEGALFADWIAKPTERLTLVAGARADSFEASGRTYVSPRMSATWAFSERTSLTASAGRFVQPLPLAFYYAPWGERDVTDPSSDHAVLGLSHLLTPATRLTVEVYRKEYSHLPMDPDAPWVSLIDEAFGGGLFFHQQVLSTGRGETDGVEVYVQKKLKERVYGMAGVSVYRSRYEGLDGVWRSRPYDNRVTASLEGGWHASERWQLSARWLYAGGRPYTPFDLAASQAANEAVLDPARVNDERLPAYHSLNLRVDRRFNFSGANLTVYLDLWNVYNRANIDGFYWDETDRGPEKSRQFGRLPVLGVEFEF